ncbi:hypothetical protein ACTQ4F_02760 [Streptococcus alactolyticus]|uniref:hypothetical protein n=1 Tax=Streptococcus alactolyticus TaxID=29389 RepID=UPI003F9A0233
MIFVGNCVVNTDYIVSVQPGYNNNCTRVNLSNGDYLYGAADIISDVYGEDDLKQIIHIPDLTAVYEEEDGSKYTVPVLLVGLAYDGSIHPVDIQESTADYMDKDINFIELRYKGRPVYAPLESDQQ